MIKKIIYISILLVFIFNNAAISSDLSLAKDAYNKNDFEAAYNYWEPLANEGGILKSECISKHFINC